MQSKYYFGALALAAALPFGSGAQTDTLHSIQGIRLDEVVFSSSKFNENKKFIAQPITVIGGKEIRWASPQTAATMLEQTGSVFVQRSQLGGGSPALRGFEASRVLLVVDGVRMNNAIYRAGHLQNVITLDNNILDRVEVMYGPASTLYGSDALGGVVLFRTRDPQLSSNDKLLTRANAMYRFSSAYNEHTGHADFSIGGRRFASLTSITYSDFGDLRQGSFRNPFNPDFGKREEYVERINGVDSIVKNDDPNVQKQSAYHQVDLLQKFLFRQKENLDHVLNVQYSTSSDIPRYDRLTEYRNGKLRYAEWYYGPQDRLMASYQLRASRLNGWFDEFQAGVNYQNIEESRHQRSRGNDFRQSRTEKVNVIGFNADLRKLAGRHELTLGIDGQYNDVNSEAQERNIISGEEGPLDTRYPDGGSKMMYGALYAQYFYKIVPEKLVLNAGARLNYVKLQADFNDTAFFRFPYSEASQSNVAASGNLGLVYLPGKRWRAALSLSTGFRAPNVDDLAKVFESAGGTQIVVPNPDLKPEYTYNGDLSLSYFISDRLKVEVSGFYTLFRNAIVQDRFTFNGQDSILYDGSMTAVVAGQNKAKAYIYGFNASFNALLNQQVSLYGALNYTYGRYRNAEDIEVPLDHVAPVYGKLGIAYRQNRFSGEFFTLFNGAKLLRDYNPYGEDNLQYATSEGMPAWYTLNLRTGYQVHKHVYVQAALENILDYNYRVFASGIHSAGRNLVLTIRGSF